jgi:hypothetical protein
LTPPVGAGVGETWGERCFRWIRFSGLPACRRFSWHFTLRRRFRAADRRRPSRSGRRRSPQGAQARAANPAETAAGNMVTSSRNRRRP